jgi:hypothetical protein
MKKLDSYLSDIDLIRLRRAKELSEVKSCFASSSDRLPYQVNTKAVIVLAYSHWEGFYNDCIDVYLSFLRDSGRTVSNTQWSMLTGIVSTELDRIRDRNHSPQARLEFVQTLSVLMASDFSGFQASIVLARSNLDFAKLKQNYQVLGFDLAKFQPKRIRIDKELVGWRHQVAHGDNPDLSLADSKCHIKFTQDLILALADQFQEAIVSIY